MIKRIAVGVFLCFAMFHNTVVFAEDVPSTQPSTQPTTFKLPDQWTGGKSDSQDGNPYLSDGKPLWIAYHVWPDDNQNPDNYKPLIWTRERWGLLKKSEGEHMDCPAVTMANGEVFLQLLASKWGGTKPNTNKTPALAFIAPREATYSISAFATGATESDKFSIRFFIVKNDKASKEIKTLANEVIANGETVQFDDLEVDLSANDEIIFTPWFDKGIQMGSIHLTKFSISAK